MAKQQTDDQDPNYVQLLEGFYKAVNQIKFLAKDRFYYMHEFLAYAVRIRPNMNQLIFSIATENRNIAKFDYELAFLNTEVARLNYKVSKNILYATDEQKRDFGLALKHLRPQIQKLRKMHPERQTSILSDSEKRQVLALCLNGDEKNQENIPHDEQDSVFTLEYKNQPEQTYLKQLACLTSGALDLEHLARNTYYESDRLFSSRQKINHINHIDDSELYKYYRELHCLLDSKKRNLNMDSFNIELNQLLFSSDENSFLSIDSQLENYPYYPDVANFDYARTFVRHQITKTNFKLAEKSSSIAPLSYKALRHPEQNPKEFVNKFFDGWDKVFIDEINISAIKIKEYLKRSELE